MKTEDGEKRLEELYDKIFNAGRKQGFQDGCAFALSYFLGAIDDISDSFTEASDVYDGSDLRYDAENILRGRKLKEGVK